MACCCGTNSSSQESSLGDSTWEISDEPFTSASACPCDIERPGGIAGSIFVKMEWSNGAITCEEIPQNGRVCPSGSIPICFTQGILIGRGADGIADSVVLVTDFDGPREEPMTCNPISATFTMTFNPVHVGICVPAQNADVEISEVPC